MNAESVGTKITARRKALGMTQKELADRLHVTDGAVSKWERGINFPEVTLLEPLAKTLNTTVIDLLSLENADGNEIAGALTTISLDEKKRLVKDLKSRGYFKIFIEHLLLAALIVASKIFDNYGIGGLAQSLTLGMCGFVGTLVGCEIFTIRNLPKLC